MLPIPWPRLLINRHLGIPESFWNFYLGNIGHRIRKYGDKQIRLFQPCNDKLVGADVVQPRVVTSTE